MKLEPTEEQLRAIERAAFRSDGPSFAHIIWRLIAPMVLEAAAQECENLPGRLSLDGPLVAVGCARAVRAMKGSPRAEIGTGEFQVCNRCGRKTWASGDFHIVCGLRQPNGHACPGMFVSPIRAEIGTDAGKEGDAK